MQKKIIKLEPYLTMVGLLFILSYAGNFSLDYYKDIHPDVAIMLTPLGLIRSQFFSYPDWLLPYYHQEIDAHVSLDVLTIVPLLWLRFIFYLKSWSL